MVEGLIVHLLLLMFLSCIRKQGMAIHFEISYYEQNGNFSYIVSLLLTQ